MIVQRTPISLLVLSLLQLVPPSWTYELKSCCLNEKSVAANKHNGTNRLLTCPINFVIKLRSVIFYAGNGCARSACQKRLNKHYLLCNNHRTCSISVKCIHMDALTCPWLINVDSHSQYLVVDYDCVLYEPEPPMIALNRLHSGNQTKKETNENIVLFSAKVNIESPPDFYNESASNENEHDWKEFLLKKYLAGGSGQATTLIKHGEKTIIIQEQRSLFSDILRTIVILVVFAFVLILIMIIALLVYKRMKSIKKKHFYQQEKHRPFPADDAYDNLKTSATQSITDSGTTTDV